MAFFHIYSFKKEDVTLIFNLVNNNIYCLCSYFLNNLFKPRFTFNILMRLLDIGMIFLTCIKLLMDLEHIFNRVWCYVMLSITYII